MKKIILLLLSILLYVAAYPAPGKKQVRLVITRVSNFVSDITDVYLDLGDTSDFAFAEDGQKIIDTANNTPLIYSVTTDNVPCFSNSYGSFTKPVSIPIGVRFPAQGQYKISASLIDNYDPTSIITLEDKVTGIFTNLRMTYALIKADSNFITNSRFVLHISYPSQLQVTKAGCQNNDGVIAVTQDTTVTWNSCVLYDNNMNVVSTLNNVTGAFGFYNLPEGYYFVVFIYGQYVASKDAPLDGDFVSVSISADKTTAAVGEMIHFTSTTTNTTSFVWTFGDSAVITGIANPDISYYTPGTYTVTVTCANSFGCTAQAQMVITIYQASGINDPFTDMANVYIENNSINVQLSQTASLPAELVLYNLSGQVVSYRYLMDSMTRLDAASLQKGIYVLSIKNALGSYTRKIVLP